VLSPLVKNLRKQVDRYRNIKFDASLYKSLPTSGLASARTESIDTSCPWYDVEEARYVEETTQDLGLMSCTACLLLPHKPNHCKIDPPARCRQYHSKHVSGVCAPLPPKSSDSGDDRQMRTWLNWRKNWGWLWESNRRSHHRLVLHHLATSIRFDGDLDTRLRIFHHNGVPR